MAFVQFNFLLWGNFQIIQIYLVGPRSTRNAGICVFPLYVDQMSSTPGIPIA